MIGELLGDRYRILRKIGEGGMAFVYVALDEKLNRQVAVKVLHEHMEKNPDIRKRFQQEAHAISSLEHPNIVKIFDFSGTDQGKLWIVTEYIQGKNLAQIADSAPGGWLHHVISCCVVREVCKALEKAHESGIVHRDVKPENIMITSDGLTKLMDFGIAKNQQRAGLTMTGTFMGSPSYMSPEQIRGRDIDLRSDLYSLGVLLYEIVTGRLPFSGSTTHEVILKITEGQYVQPRFLVPMLPAKVDEIINHAMAKNPDDRYQTARQMGKELEQLLSEQNFDESHIELERCFKNPQSYGQRLARLTQIKNEVSPLAVTQKITELRPAATKVPAVTVKQSAPKAVAKQPAAPEPIRAALVPVAIQQPPPPPAVVFIPSQPIALPQAAPLPPPPPPRRHPKPKNRAPQARRVRRVVHYSVVTGERDLPIGFFALVLLIIGALWFYNRNFSNVKAPEPVVKKRPPVSAPERRQPNPNLKIDSDVGSISLSIPATPRPATNTKPTIKDAPREVTQVERKIERPRSERPASPIAPSAPSKETKPVSKPKPRIAVASTLPTLLPSLPATAIEQLPAPKEEEVETKEAPAKETPKEKVKGNGSFAISSQPAAEVFIAGKKVGTTNDTGSGSRWIDLPEGQHRVELRRSGYEAETIVVNISAREKNRVPTVTLRRQAQTQISLYRLTITCNQSPAQVTITNLDTKNIQSHTLQGNAKVLQLESGSYEVVIDWQGQKKVRRIELAGGNNQLTFHAEFKPVEAKK